MKNSALHTSIWKIIIPPILTTSLMYFSLKGWENVLFELGVNGLILSLIESDLSNVESFARLQLRGVEKTEGQRQGEAWYCFWKRWWILVSISFAIRLYLRQHFTTGSRTAPPIGRSNLKLFFLTGWVSKTSVWTSPMQQCATWSTRPFSVCGKPGTCSSTATAGRQEPMPEAACRTRSLSWRIHRWGRLSRHKMGSPQIGLGVPPPSCPVDCYYDVKLIANTTMMEGSHLQGMC